MCFLTLSIQILKLYRIFHILLEESSFKRFQSSHFSKKQSVMKIPVQKQVGSPFGGRKQRVMQCFQRFLTLLIRLQLDAVKFFPLRNGNGLQHQNLESDYIFSANSGVVYSVKAIQLVEINKKSNSARRIYSKKLSKSTKLTMQY